MPSAAATVRFGALAWRSTTSSSNARNIATRKFPLLRRLCWQWPAVWLGCIEAAPSSWSSCNGRRSSACTGGPYIWKHCENLSEDDWRDRDVP
eukprot:4844843-Pleurochrysis_carterae.AAC.1